MKVSVVIPAYNEEKYIVDCLKALSNQTVAPDEVIVVDNNSTDKTASLARQAGAKVITVLEPGITPARTAGFNAAKYPIIARCDADSRPFPDWIARIKIVMSDPELAGITGTNRFYGLGRFKTSFYSWMFTVVYFGGNRLLLGHEAFYGSNMAIRRSIWHKISKQTCSDDRIVHEDIDLAIHIVPYGKIVYQKGLLVGCSPRALHVSIGTISERLRKWPRTRLVHTRFKALVKPGKKPSSTAQNLL